MADRKVEPHDDAIGPDGAEAPPEHEGRVARFHSQDGLSLALRFFDCPDRSRLPLLCLPGLSRNSRDFIRLGRFFAEHPIEPRPVIAVDYRGRGLSDDDPNWRNYKPIAEAQDVITAAAAFGLDRAIVVGTSRGGILAMLLGALRPTLLAGVVLNDIGPVIEGRGLARIRGYLSVKRRSVETWDAAVAEVRATSEAQYPGLANDEWRALTSAYYGEAENGFAALFDPKLSKAVADIDPTEKIPMLWPQFMSLARVPVLAIRGALSDLLSPQTLTEMADRHPRFESLTVERQGHAPLLRDAPTLEQIRAFAERCDAECAVLEKKKPARSA